MGLLNKNKLNGDQWTEVLKSKDIQDAFNVPTNEEFKLAEQTHTKLSYATETNRPNEEESQAYSKVVSFIFVMGKLGFLLFLMGMSYWFIVQILTGG